MAIMNIGRIQPVYKGEWDTEATYVALDFVLHTNDTLYIALKAVPASFEPVAQAEYWAPFGSKGMTGNGIKSFVYVESQLGGDLWKMTFTDDKTADILVPKGTKGDRGNGIVSITFDKALDNGDYQYAIVMDDGTISYIISPQGPTISIVRKPEVVIAGDGFVDKWDFVINISPFASLYDAVFEERVIDIALDPAFNTLAVTATITAEDEERNTYTVNQLLIDYGTKYYVRVRDKNSLGDLSNYSLTAFAETKQEIREIKQPTILTPAAGAVLATIVPSFTFSDPEWVSSTGAIDKMQVVISSNNVTLFNSGWVPLETAYTVADFSYLWGSQLSVTVQYAEGASNLRSPTSLPVAYSTQEAYVATPSITHPIAGSKIGTTGIEIVGSEFLSVGYEDTHAASFWTIYGDSEKTQVLWRSGRTVLDLTSITANPTPTLPSSTPVWIGVSYEGASIGVSIESSLIGVTVGSVIAPTITSPKPGEYKTAGNVVITGTAFSSYIPADTQKAIHGKVVLASDLTVVRWRGSIHGVITQITASWTLEGDGQEDLLCSIAYEGMQGGMGAWSEPVLVRLVKSGVSIPVITWPLNGEKYADPNILRVNAERPLVKSNLWTGTEWQVSKYANFSELVAGITITDTDVLPNRVLADINIGGQLGTHLYLRCRHIIDIGRTNWSDVVEFDAATHQTFWEMIGSSEFVTPVNGIYDVLCVGSGGVAGKNTTVGGSVGIGGGGGAGYIAVGALLFSDSQTVHVTIDSVATSVGTIVAANGGDGGPGSNREYTGSYYGLGGNGGTGGGGGGGGSGGGGVGSQQALIPGKGIGGISVSGANGGDGSQATNATSGGGGGGGGGGVKGANGLANSNTGGLGGNGGGDGGSGGNLVEGGAGRGMGGGRGSKGVASGGGGGGGGYGCGKDFDINPYYASHLPFKNFNHITTGAGYVRIMYKGPTGDGA